jgi:hypothetical protein
MSIELIFKLDKIVTTEGKDDKVKVQLKAEDDNENEFTLSVTFDNEYPEGWKRILGRSRGDTLIVTVERGTQQTELIV